MSGVNFERAHSDSDRETTFYQSVMLCFSSRQGPNGFLVIPELSLLWKYSFETLFCTL